MEVNENKAYSPNVMVIASGSRSWRFRIVPVPRYPSHACLVMKANRSNIQEGHYLYLFKRVPQVHRDSCSILEYTSLSFPLGLEYYSHHSSLCVFYLCSNNGWLRSEFWQLGFLFPRDFCRLTAEMIDTLYLPIFWMEDARECALWKRRSTGCRARREVATLFRCSSSLWSTAVSVSVGMCVHVEPNAVYRWWEWPSLLVHCLFPVDCNRIFLVVPFVYVLMRTIMTLLFFLCFGTILSLEMFHVLLLSVTILSC